MGVLITNTNIIAPTKSKAEMHMRIVPNPLLDGTFSSIGLSKYNAIPVTKHSVPRNKLAAEVHWWAEDPKKRSPRKRSTTPIMSKILPSASLKKS